jgi:hypothetical protein
VEEIVRGVIFGGDVTPPYPAAVMMKQMDSWRGGEAMIQIKHSAGT